jgi:hypothetical protein
MSKLVIHFARLRKKDMPRDGYTRKICLRPQLTPILLEQL